MFRIAYIAAAFFLSSVSASAVLQRRDDVVLRGLLAVRQLGDPTIPDSSGDNACDATCNTASDDFSCQDVSCICVDSHLQDLADCYSCLTPFLVGDPAGANWPQQAQATLSAITSGCQELGFSVSEPEFDGNPGSPASTDSGSTPTDGDIDPFPAATSSDIGPASSQVPSSDQSADPSQAATPSQGAESGHDTASSTPANPGVSQTPLATSGATSSASITTTLLVAIVGAVLVLSS